MTETAPIDFVISNDRHHVATLAPVIECLTRRTRRACRIVSLCELRGIETPVERLPVKKEAVVNLFPHRVRRSAATGGRRSGGRLELQMRRLARRLCGDAILKRTMERWLKDRPALVIVPNDAAFPYDVLCALLHAHEIPFVLVQEGIRFALPAEGELVYGANGAVRVAAWGEASADYFHQAGVSAEHLRLTGCPRFDCIAQTDWTRAVSQLRERFRVGERTILLLTNPIDDQGFCTTREKMDLVRSLVRSILPTLNQEDGTLIIKLHAREAVADYEALLDGLPPTERIRVLGSVPLYPLLAGSAGAITMASTVGLEALLFGVPLGVVKLPGFGYVHDYVSEGAAWGLESDVTAGTVVREMLRPSRGRSLSVEAYLDRHVSRRAGATEEVADVILESVA